MKADKAQPLLVAHTHTHSDTHSGPITPTFYGTSGSTAEHSTHLDEASASTMVVTGRTAGNESSMPIISADLAARTRAQPHTHADTHTGPTRGRAAHIPLVKRLSHSTYVTASHALLICVYIAVIVLACIVVWQLVVRHSERHVVAWAVGALCVCVAVPLSLHDIHMHMFHYVRPDLQKYYIRILWMVPIYAVESWLALRFKDQAVYLEVAREAYEAYVIYNFFHLLASFLGGEAHITAHISAKSRGVKLMFPFCCVRWPADHRFFRRTAIGTLQYVAIRFILAIVTFVLQLLDLYGEGEWTHAGRGYVYIAVILNASQAWAMYCLVLFYHELKQELAPLKPLGKFLVVKAVVFFSFWQGIVISALVFKKVIQPTLDYTEEEVAKGLQDFLICIEMMLAAIAHTFAFSYKDFMVDHDHPLSPKLEDAKAVGAGTPLALARAALEMLPADVITDAGRHIANHLPLPKALRTPRANTASVEAPNPVRAASAGPAADATITTATAHVDDSADAVPVTVTSRAERVDLLSRGAP